MVKGITSFHMHVAPSGREADERERVVVLEGDNQIPPSLVRLYDGRLVVKIGRYLTSGDHYSYRVAPLFGQIANTALLGPLDDPWSALHDLLEVADAENLRGPAVAAARFLLNRVSAG